MQLPTKLRNILSHFSEFLSVPDGSLPVAGFLAFVFSDTKHTYLIVRVHEHNISPLKVYRVPATMKRQQSRLSIGCRSPKFILKWTSARATHLVHSTITQNQAIKEELSCMPMGTATALESPRDIS